MRGYSGTEMRRVAKAMLCAGLALAGCGGASPAARTSAERAGAPAPARDELSKAAGELARAFDQRLTVWTRPDGSRVHVRHCRKAPGGCRARIAAFSRMIASVADAQGIDPFLLGALVMRESALEPAAVGAQGEAGLVQLHPRGAGHDVRFVQDADYRERCVREVRACQRPVLEVGARFLSKAIAKCGTPAAGLGFYSTGSCDPGARYARRVLEERRRLRSYVE